MDITIENNKILNYEDIVEKIENGEVSIDLLKNMLNSLVNNEQYSEVLNKDELIGIINKQISLMEGEKTNKESLEELQKINPELKRLSICETSSVNNDSKKNCDYLVLEDEFHKVKRVLDFKYQNQVNQFIKEMGDKLVTWSAEEIFDYFYTNITGNIEFEELDKVSQDPKLGDKFKEESIENDNSSIRTEVSSIRSFKKKYDILEEPKIGIDKNGERIYLVGGAVIKFRKGASGQRIMDFLKKPDFLNMSYEQEELIGENKQTPDLEEKINEDDEKIQENLDPEKSEINYSEGVFENDEIKYDVIDSEAEIDFDTLDYDQMFPYEPFSSSTLDKMQELIVKKTVYGEPLNKEENMFLHASIKKLVTDWNVLVQDTDAYYNSTNISFSQYEDCLRDIVSPYIEKYERVQEGFLDKHVLSEFEARMVETYQNSINETKEATTAIKSSIKTLTKKDKKDKSQVGLLFVTLLVELFAFALILMLILHIDI